MTMRRTDSVQAGAENNVIPFPTRHRQNNRLSVRDRITLLDWGVGSRPEGGRPEGWTPEGGRPEGEPPEAGRPEGGRAAGIGRVVIETWEMGEDPSVVGDFAMIYRLDTDWASWAVAHSNGRYQVWETAFGQTLGVFPMLPAALACLETQAALVSASSMPRPQTRRLKASGASARAGTGKAGCRRVAASS